MTTKKTPVAKTSEVNDNIEERINPEAVESNPAAEEEKPEFTEVAVPVKDANGMVMGFRMEKRKTEDMPNPIALGGLAANVKY